MSTLKLAAVQLGLHGGLFRLAQFAARRQQAIILMFHRFLGNGEGHVRGLPIERFEQYISYLTCHYRVVSLGTLTEELRQGTVRPYTVAVTVDDGYHEAFTLAAPILRRYKVPAAFFVVSDFVDGWLWLWTDRFRFVFDQAPQGRVAFKYRGSIHVVEMSKEWDRLLAEEQWREFAKKLAVPEREELLEVIAEAWGVKIPVMPPREYLSMTWGQLCALAAEGFDVGAHSRTHPILSSISSEQLQAEIDGCKEQIERHVGYPVRYFAYPNGRKEDYTTAAVEAVARAGYLAAFTTVPGGNTPSTSLFELYRICPRVESLAHFAQSVSGFEEVRVRMRG